MQPLITHCVRVNECAQRNVFHDRLFPQAAHSPGMVSAQEQQSLVMSVFVCSM